jgi:hypothetical protein
MATKGTSARPRLTDTESIYAEGWRQAAEAGGDDIDAETAEILAGFFADAVARLGSARPHADTPGPLRSTP